MHTGETANGAFPAEAVRTMAAIVANAETGIDFASQLSFIRYWVTRGGTHELSLPESVLVSAASMAVGYHEDTTPEMLRRKAAKPHLTSLIVCMSEAGAAARLISKYRPPCPVVVLSTSEQLLRLCNAVFGQIPLWVPSLDLSAEQAAKVAADLVASRLGVSVDGCNVVVAKGLQGGNADKEPVRCMAVLLGNVL
jgi:pyruvate kinase